MATQASHDCSDAWCDRLPRCIQRIPVLRHAPMRRRRGTVAAARQNTTLLPHTMSTACTAMLGTVVTCGPRAATRVRCSAGGASDTTLVDAHASRRAVLGGAATLAFSSTLSTAPPSQAFAMPQLAGGIVPRGDALGVEGLVRPSAVIKGCWQLSGGHRGDAKTDRTCVPTMRCVYSVSWYATCSR